MSRRTSLSRPLTQHSTVRRADSKRLLHPVCFSPTLLRQQPPSYFFSFYSPSGINTVKTFFFFFLFFIYFPWRRPPPTSSWPLHRSVPVRLVSTRHLRSSGCQTAWATGNNNNNYHYNNNYNNDNSRAGQDNRGRRTSSRVTTAAACPCLAVCGAPAASRASRRISSG